LLSSLPILRLIIAGTRVSPDASPHVWPWGVCLLVLLGAGCVSSPPAADRNAHPPTWPPPPAEPRIVFEEAISGPADLGITLPAWKRALAFLTGGQWGYQPFVKPSAVYLDEKGNLCVSDVGAASVCYYDRARNRFKRWERIGNTSFLSPVAVVKVDDVIFVADTGLGTVLAFDVRGKRVFEIEDEVSRPSGLAICGERLLVADAQRHRVAAFDFQGRFLSAFGKRGTEPGAFNFPTHITVAPATVNGAPSDLRVYVTDSMNFRIQVFDTDGTLRQVIGSAGDSSGHFSRPKGIAVDASGHLYVVDALFDNVQVFDREGRFLMDWGSAGSAPGEFWLPAGITVDPGGRILVADAYNGRIQQFKYIGQK